MLTPCGLVVVVEFHSTHERHLSKTNILAEQTNHPSNIVNITMPRTPTLRARTVHRIGKIKCNQTCHHCHMHLTLSQACFRSNLQIFFHGAAAMLWSNYVWLIWAQMFANVSVCLKGTADLILVEKIVL